MIRKLFYMVLGSLAILEILIIGVVKAEVIVTYNTGNHIHYTLNGNLDFVAGTITIVDNEDGTSITILDRNLGATEAGAGCRSTGYGNCDFDDTYGYVFQWGNNYGFDVNSMLLTDSIQVVSPIQLPYTNSKFILGNDNWLDDDSIVNLWGGRASDYIDDLDGDNWKINNSSSRRGPCPSGFHVPSYGELMKIFDLMGNSVDRFHSDLLIPFAGWADYSSDDYSLLDLGLAACLWSSSPESTDSPLSWEFYMDISKAYEFWDDGRACGYAVRCIYDYYEPYTPAPSVNTGGTTNISITVHTGEVNILLESGGVVTFEAQSSSFFNKSVSVDFPGWVMIDDVKGSSNGYYVTVSISDLVADLASNVDGTEFYKIPNSNITFNANYNPGDFKRAGATNPQVQVGMGDYVGSGEFTYIYRNAGTLPGILGKYGTKPCLTVNIPANTPAAMYTGTIVFTLYEN